MVKSVLIFFFLPLMAFAVNQHNQKQATRTDYFKHEIKNVMQEVTPTGRSALETRLLDEKRLSHYPLSLTLFHPSYILPYYNTTQPFGI